MLESGLVAWLTVMLICSAGDASFRDSVGLVEEESGHQAIRGKVDGTIRSLGSSQAQGEARSQESTHGEKVRERERLLVSFVHGRRRRGINRSIRPCCMQSNPLQRAKTDRRW